MIGGCGPERRAGPEEDVDLLRDGTLSEPLDEGIEQESL